MPDMPRTKFNSPWTVANIEAELNGTKNARGALTMTEKLAQKVETSAYATDKAVLDAEIAAVANAGAKNLLKTTAAYGPSIKTNITFTHNSNESLTVTSTGSNATYTDYYISADEVTLQPGKYILTGCPSGGDNSSTYKLQAAGIGYDTGEGFEFTITQETAVNVYIRIWGGYAPNNLVFRPMIRPAAISDQTYEPYAPTNRELYEMILALQNGA